MLFWGFLLKMREGQQQQKKSWTWDEQITFNGRENKGTPGLDRWLILSVFFLVFRRKDQINKRPI